MVRAILPTLALCLLRPVLSGAEATLPAAVFAARLQNPQNERAGQP